MLNPFEIRVSVATQMKSFPAMAIRKFLVNKAGARLLELVLTNDSSFVVLVGVEASVLGVAERMMRLLDHVGVVND